jgi:hypothetical protein
VAPNPVIAGLTIATGGGPQVPDARLGAGPFGRLERRPLAFYQEPISLHVGAIKAQA